METTIHAIVLRRKDSGETDRRLTLLTEEFGKIDVVAKGARKAASRLAGSSDPLSVALMSLASGKRNRFVTQAQPMNSYRGLRSNFERLSLALALCELFSAVLPWEEPVPEAFELLGVSLGQLESHPKPQAALAWAEVRLLGIAGFLPEFSRCVQTGSEVREARPMISPRAGGYVSDACLGQISDGFRVRYEVLVALGRLAELSEPPNHLKFADETLLALFPFWQAVAETALPANQAAMAALRADAEA